MTDFAKRMEEVLSILPFHRPQAHSHDIGMTTLLPFNLIPTRDTAGSRLINNQLATVQCMQTFNSWKRQGLLD